MPNIGLTLNSMVWLSTSPLVPALMPFYLPHLCIFCEGPLSFSPWGLPLHSSSYLLPLQEATLLSLLITSKPAIKKSVNPHSN